MPRKDVERRLYVLRKEQIRNTALRFRFQMVLQQYNTYQTHWQRVCREIENGTYKRHLMRAQRRFGSMRPQRRGSMRPPEFHPEPGAPLPKDLAAELATLDEDFAPASFDVDVSFDEKPSSRPRPPLAPSPEALAPNSPALATPAPPRPAGPGGAPAWKKVGTPAAPPAPASPSLHRAPAASAHPPQPGGRPLAPGSPPAPRPPAPAAPIAAQWPPRPAASTGPSAVQRPGPPPRAPVSLPAPASPAVSPQRVAPPVASPPRSTGPAPNRPAPVPPTTAAGRPPAPRPSPSNRPPSFPTPRPPPGSAELSEKRMRQIYVEYVDAKRRQNESTAAITYQSVAKSLRESGDRLRQKHGKAVDFEVAVKDGKTVLRPVLK